MAGMLGGMLMGMTWSGYAAVLFTFDPPAVLRNRIEAGAAARATMAIAFGSIAVWVMLGVGAALIADAAMAGVGGSYALVPSSTYAALLLVLLMVAGVPLFGFMRDKALHVAIWLALVLGIYGGLIPNLVIALQNRA